MELITIKLSKPVTKASLIADRFKKKKVEVLGFINRAGFSEAFYNKNFFLIEKANKETTENNFDYYITYDGFTAITAALSGTIADKARSEFIHAFGKYPVDDENSKMSLVNKNIAQIESILNQLKNEVKF
ncbi:hypothetical protein [Pedobacter sp. Leaf132]|uniref:hypothetical protein n=1 Tax=Pedobacter sp. Leaf132 TaxID=2876557 RepID=UPI001E4A9F51|nr:hypothetical protein [Pedobacter sp. Leaf132]